MNGCQADLLDKWILQACQGIGGSSLTQQKDINNGWFIGREAICLCAHGDTDEHDYVISDPPYSPGNASLKNDVKETYTCKRPSCNGCPRATCEGC